LTSEGDMAALRAQYPHRQLEICPSRFCRLTVRKRVAIMAVAALGPAVISLAFAVAEPLLRSHGVPERPLEIVVLLLLGSLWLAWIILRGGGRISMDAITLLESGLSGRTKHMDFEPVFDRANARAQLDAFLDELQESRYTGTIPIQYKGGEPRRVSATEELDLSLPPPLAIHESKEGQRLRS